MTNTTSRDRPDEGQVAESRPLSKEIAGGNEALARCDWELARASFEDALKFEETPEALEGLGMAAWWLDDGSTVFEARERAYRLYRQHGDRRGAGRVAMTLAEDYFHFRGEVAVARGWHQRAHRLLDGLEPTAEHGWLKLWEGDFALKIGDDPARARQLGVEAAARARVLGDVNLEMVALALEGVALVIQGEVSEGMPRLDEATAAVVSGDMTDPIAVGLSCCYLVHACEFTRDFERAAEWCQRVKTFCERTRFNFLLAVCRAQYAGVLTWRGSWAEAEEEFQAAAQKLGVLRPALQQEALIGLANLRRQQGRFEEAAALLKQIEGHPASVLCRAALALDRSEPATAAQLAQRFLRQLPVLNRTDRVGALEVLLRAQLAIGHHKEAQSTLEQLEAIVGMVATEAVKAHALVAGGLVASARGDHERARNAFEDAIELFTRSGAAFELARCRVELARVLLALGERSAAKEELRQALLTFESLGAAHDAEAARSLSCGAAAIEPPTRAGNTSSARLTPREIEVLRLVAQGMSNQKIAERLVVSEFTIKRHVTNLLTKLSLPSRAAAAAYAAREGLA